MLMDQSNDCELYQEWLSMPYQELEHSQQSALEHHLLNCSTCALYKGESDLLCSLLNRLPVPDMEPGLPLQLEELLQRSQEEVVEQLVTGDFSLSEEGEYSYRTAFSGKRDCANCLASFPRQAGFCPTCGCAPGAVSDPSTLPNSEKIPTVPLKLIDMSGYRSVMHPPRPMRYPVRQGVAALSIAMLLIAIILLQLGSTIPTNADEAHATPMPVPLNPMPIPTPSNSMPTLPPSSPMPTPTPPYEIGVDPHWLSFTVTQGDDNPGSQSIAVITVGLAGTVTTSFSTNDGEPWLSVSPGGSMVASSNFAISVSVKTQGLSAGSYIGCVALTFTDVHNASTTQRVLVELTVIPTCPPCVDTAPFSLTAQQWGGNPRQSFSGRYGSKELDSS